MVIRMVLKVLGSGSAGNCYLLENETECLAIEAGVNFLEVKKAVKFQVNKIVGCIFTHQHADHSKYIKAYMESAIPVYTSDETQSDMEIITGEYTRALQPHSAVRIGGFTVQSFEVVHDVPCVGFYIKHKDFGKLLYITDTEYVPQNFKGLNINHILVEANYSKDLISVNYHNSLANRIKLSHMEIDTTVEFLRANQTVSLYNVVLLHLSDNTSSESQFIAKAKSVVKCHVYIATKGLEVGLGMEIF